MDIQGNEIDPFRQEIARLAPGSTLEAVPMLRGRITQLNGVPVDEAIARITGAIASRSQEL